MLIPVSRCVRALAERGELTDCEIEEADPHFLSSIFQGPLLTPQKLLARLLVVAGSPSAGSELQAAALLLLQNLHSKIHRAVGAMWAAEIPLLLQCLDGKDESFPGSAEWEQRLLKFLRASLETVEDEAWTKALSCELSRWLGSSSSSSGEKSFLYKALGTALGACKEVLHVQEKLLKHLEEANAEQRSEAQVRSPPASARVPGLSLGQRASPGPAPGPFDRLLLPLSEAGIAQSQLEPLLFLVARGGEEEGTRREPVEE
ncbi:maestro heat-like repeat-containing protein family member 1 [Numida meleagris]|uniref:maestro heat-like repeat-containing protein family member 1 n=1 Tax=Numida meleagris TaxID=8996 RepID=UPI000B3E3F79|nr:maestro heat-like repeat-containing protein family member 1 [Numida meleagris]